MGIFNKSKNKKFDYKPRYFKFDGEGSPFGIKHKFDEHRNTHKTGSGLKGKFNAAMGELKSPQEKKVLITIFIIIAVLVLISLYIIDFDLSIFNSKSHP